MDGEVPPAGRPYPVVHGPLEQSVAHPSRYRRGKWRPVRRRFLRHRHDARPPAQCLADHARRRSLLPLARRQADSGVQYRQFRPTDQQAEVAHRMRRLPGYRHPAARCVCAEARNPANLAVPARTRRWTVHPAEQRSQPGTHRQVRQYPVGGERTRAGVVQPGTHPYLYEPLCRLRQRTVGRIHQQRAQPRRQGMGRHHRQRPEPVPSSRQHLHPHPFDCRRTYLLDV